MLAAAGTIALPVRGATILAEDFVGVAKTTTSPVATIDAWDALNGVTFSGLNFTITEASDLGTGDAPLGYEDDAGPEEASLNVDAKTWNAGDTWVVQADTFALDASTQSISLDAFDFNSFSTGNGGQFRTGTNTAIEWTFSITGDLGYDESASTTTSYIQGGSFATTSDSIDLSGWADLVAGEAYTLSIRSRGTTGGDSTYSALDDITLTGTITAIPEPASIALLGIGGVLIAGRRCRA